MSSTSSCLAKLLIIVLVGLRRARLREALVMLDSVIFRRRFPPENC